MKYVDFHGLKLSRLGLGNMRLPLVNPDDPKSLIDYKKAHEIIDMAYAKGITYFDTAYVYNSGDSEKCLGECMKKHPRNTFYIATKFFIGANPDYKAVFAEQLKRLQTDYIDFYLIHCVMDGNAQKYIDSGAIEYFLNLKKQGKIRYLGFSSHASVETLEMFASHHDWDFAQIQFNYYDYSFTTAKKEYEILERKHIPTVVMEPVRGGRLATLNEDANVLLKSEKPDWSIARWALEFVKARKNVYVVLSGMSNLGQLKDNLNTFSEDNLLTDKGEKILFEAANIFKKSLEVPCTGCCYCTDGCPMEINIPQWTKLYNEWKVEGSHVFAKAKDIKSKGTPKDCIACGACTSHCPQSIDVPKVMAELAEKLPQ